MNECTTACENIETMIKTKDKQFEEVKNEFEILKADNNIKRNMIE